MASNRKFLLLCAFVVGAVAVPVSKREQCARYCTEEGDFKLRPGSTYTYDYETTTTTTVQGSSLDKTQIQLTAQVDIEVLSKCDLSLRLRGVTLKLSDPKSPEYLNAIRGARDFARSVERHILRFSFQNGKVEHVCPSEDVPVWVTNIHKGVLSAFQTYILQPDWSTTALETDILGKCTAEYQSLGTSWQGTHTIRKLKDLTTCTDRENVDTYLQGTPYSQDFQRKSLPLVKGNQECEQVLGQGFLHSSTCREKLVFRPFSNGGSSVVTSVTQKLSYATVSQRTFTGSDYRPSTESLLYRHADSEANPSKREEDAETVLKQLCDATTQDISITVPRTFSAFVYKLKKLNLDSLKAFYQRIDRICPTNTKARKFFMDAIPLVSTVDSAKFMFDLISRDEISKSESNFWLTSLSFVNEPNAEIIGVFTPLLNGRHEQAILGISALIHTFCKSNDCSRVPEVQNAVLTLFRNIGESCFGGDDKKVILTLKGLSNIGIMFGKENVLENCYKNPQIRLEARLAAIQAYRRVSCDVSRDDLMTLFSNYNEDAEIRIASYLSVMTCPSNAVVDTVKDVLMAERINHVGSFVWTHLNALARSKHPQRQDIRNIVSNLYLLNKYNSDARKFSSAREATFYLEAIDSGFHVDNHLVFSTDSYLPRTAMFNLTVDVFGKTCNLFQIDGRMEGLEHLVESFFGPNGYFPQKNIAKMLREKRSLSYNKIEDLDKKFQAKSRFQQSPYGSLDVKIFGTTLWYNQFKENGDDSPDINLLEVMTKLAEEHEAEYSRSFMFLDTTFTVPMTSGLPLRIAVNGTASVGLKYGGKFDVKSFEHVDVQGHIEPSGAIEIASLLTIDAGNAARSGLRVVGTLHSSTVLDGRVEVKDGEVIKAQLNMPRDRIDVFNMKSQVFLIHGNEEMEQKVDKKGETNLKTCSSQTLSKLFGVQVCSELRIPPYKPNSALHPVNGPANLNIYIQKTDPTLKSYTFDAEWKMEVANSAVVRHGRLSFNTPDSQVDRDVSAEFFINHADKTASLKIKTPIKRLGANAKLVHGDTLSKLALGLTVDDRDYFSLQTELRTVIDKSSVTYIPSLEIKVPSRRLTYVSGSVYLKHGQKYTAQLQVEDLTEKPLLAKANLEISKRDRYEGELTINSFIVDGTVKGYAQLGDNMASRITADYKFLEGKMNNINIMGKMRNHSANSLIKYNGLLNVQASLLPEWNTELSFETMRTTGHIENTVSIQLGDRARSRVHNIKLQEILRYEGSLKNNKVDGSFSIIYPEKNIDYSIKMNHENTESYLKNVLDVQYETNRNVISEVILNVNQNSPLSIAGDVKLKYPGRETALSVSLSETSPKEYSAALSCQWKEGRQASFVINYKDKTDSTRFKYEVEGEMNLPLRSPITFSSVVGAQQGQFVGFANLNVGLDKYHIKAEYGKGRGLLNHRAFGQLELNNKMYGLEAALQNAGNKLSCNVEVKMPNRHRMTAKFEGRTGDYFKAGSFETLWDADRDASKRFGINGELRGHADGYEGKILMQILRRTVTGTLSTSMKGRFLGAQWNTNNKLELEWSPNEKATAVISSNVLIDQSKQEVNGQFEITTPFFNYENLSMSLTHFYANQQWESEISTNLPQNKQIKLGSSGKFSFIRGGATVETKATLQTSFSQLRDSYFELSHDHNSKELTSKVQFRWGRERRLTLDASGVTQPSLYKGSLKFTSPFKNFEDLSAEVIHNYSPDNYRTRSEFQWAPRRKISLNFEGKHVLNGRRRICAVSLSGSSPFRDFENTAAKITYSNDASTINTDVELTWSERKKITSSFIVALRNTPYSKNAESKFQITTPFRNYENFQISTSLETNRNSYKVNVDAQLPHGSTSSFNSQGKLSGFNDIELNAVVISHFPRYMEPQRVSIDFVHKYENSKLRSTLDTAYNKNRLTVLLLGLTEVGYNTRNVEFSATVNTPFRGYEEIKCNFNHNQRGYAFITKLEGNKNTLSGSLVHKLSLRDMLNFETTVEVSSSEFSDMKLSVIQVNNAGQLEHNSYATWDRNKRINFNAQLFDKSNIKEFSFKLTTPFRKFREFEVKSSYENQNWDHKAALSVVWDHRNKLTLSGSLRNYRWKNVNTQVEFTSSFKGYEFYSASFKYDLTAPQKSVELSYLWDINYRKAITLKGNFLHSYSLTNMELELSTPFNGFNQITFTTRVKNSPEEYNLNILYNRDSRKIELNGKAMLQRHNSEIYVEFSSPFESFREVKSTVKYDSKFEGFTGMVSTEWNRVNKYQVQGEYKVGDNAAEGKLSFLTPFRGYKTVDVQTNINYGGSRKVAEFSMKWDDDNSILVNSEYTVRRDGQGIKVRVESTFEGYEQITFDSWYKAASNLYEGQIKASINRNEIYEGNGAIKYGGEHDFDILLNIGSPDSRLRNMKFSAKIDSSNGFKRVESLFMLNNKESKFTGMYKRESDRFVEIDAKLETPYRNFRLFSIQSSLNRREYEFMNGRLKVTTPFDALRTVDCQTEITVDNTGCSFSFNVQTPEKKLGVTGKVSNRQFRPFTATLEIDAPFLSFKKLSSNAEVNIVRWDNSKINLDFTTLRSKHELSVLLQREDKSLDFQFKTESPAIPSRTIIFSTKANYEDSNNIETEVSLQLFENVHYLNGQLGRSDRNTEVQIRMESPLLPEKKADITASFSRRRNNKVLDGKLSFSVPSSIHEFSARYESKNGQVMTNLKIDSSFSSFFPFEAQAKYTNSNGKDFEATFTATTPDASHSIVGSLKNYDNEKFVQLKIECPAVGVLNSFGITGTLKHDNFDSLDGSLSISASGKELRIAGNMKNEGWRNIEAFATLNTPFEVLRMFRIDGRFRNDRYQNIDWNFQIETSNRNLPSLGVTSKISRTKGSEEISLMLHLPLKQYRQIQLLANAHYEADFSSADSRITLTIPPKRYSISGHYGINNPRISGTAELEYNGLKWVASGRLDRTLESKDVSFTFTNHRSERFNFGGVYGKSDNKHFVAGSYVSPMSEKYNVNTSLSFNDYTNFEASVQVETPFSDYRSIEASVTQQYNSNHLSSNFEVLRNGRRGFLKVIHRNMRNSASGTVQLGSPYLKFRDIKLSYNKVKKVRDQECSVELDLNRVKQFKAELLQFGDRSSHIILDVPILPLTVTADSKKIANGRELNFKSDYRSRVVGFRTAFQTEARQILHDASFTWDEKADKRISYDFKLGETATGRELWSRLDTPIRSFMLKGNFTRANRASSGGIDFYWDASRNLEKHVAVGVEHADVSTGRETSHRVKFALEHPKLSRDIIQTNAITFRQNEFHIKSELIYSRQRQHNVLLEMKASDLSRSRDSHYKGEFILRHPVSRLDIQANGEAIFSKLEAFSNLKLNYMDQGQVRHEYELKNTLSKIKQEAVISVRMDNDIRSAMARASNRNGRLFISTQMSKNEEKFLGTDLKFNSRNNTIEFSITCEGERGVHAAASYQRESASLRLWHDISGNAVTDVNVFFGLEESRVLKSQLNWRPKMWEEMRITTGENLRAFISALKERYTSVAEVVSEDLSQRLYLISRSLHEQLAPFANEISGDVSEFRRDLRNTRIAFQTMYQNNEFFMKDIVHGIENAKEELREIMSGLSLGFEVLSNIISEITDELYYNLIYGLEDLMSYIQERYIAATKRISSCFYEIRQGLSRRMQLYRKQLGKGMSYLSKQIQVMSEKAIVKIDKMVRSYAPFIIDGYYYVKNAADSIRRSFNSICDRVSNYISSNKYINALRYYAASVADTVQAFLDYDYAEAAQAVFNQIYYSQLIDSIVNHPNVEYASELANTALRKSVQIYHNLGLDMVVDSVYESATNYAKEVFFNAAEELLSDIYELRGGAKYEFAPRRGYMAVEFNLPASRNSLIEVFDFKSYPEYQKITNIKNSISSEFYDDFCIWDYYYKVLKYFKVGSWLPTFTGHAMIAGNQHYITFDKYSYDFAGKCSYLLARDFVDGNFTVIVNYGDDHLRKSLTILSDGKKIDIGNDYKITLDDTKAESPLQVGKTIVMREGANIRIENDKKGFFIVCNFINNYCSVSVSGFYYGKTGGLFGTFNYEPKLDLLTPTRHMANDLESFAKSWEVGQAACRSTENLASIPSNDYRVQERCKNMFSKSSSEFRACFKQVDPEPFLRMCVSDLSVVHEGKFDEAICESAAAYFLQCKLEGVQLKLPNYCVRCEKQDGTLMKEGDALQFTKDDVITAVDIVFLVEEKECNRERVKYIGKIAQSVEDNYKQKGYRDVRFSVVGFGGSEIHSAPHIHTLDGQESGSLRSLESAVESLVFGDGPINILEALRYAASLNFRPGTTKSFILMKCSTCKSEEVKAEYSEMLRTLLDGDISLHLLMDQRYDIKVPNKNSKGRKVFGVDKNLAYTLKDLKDPRLSGDGDLLAQLKIPKDVCIPLAFEVNGSSFDVEFLTETKKNTNKKFIDVFSRRIVRSSSRSSSEWGICCECIATVDGVGKSTCQRCVSAEIANMISGETSGMNAIINERPAKEGQKRIRKHKERKSGQ